MESRKCLVNCLNEWIEFKRRALNRLRERRALQPGFYKEKTGAPSKGTTKLFWRGTDVELLELITSLFLSGVIHSEHLRFTRKDLLNSFESFLNIQIKNSDIKLNKARVRKRDSAPFMEKLKQLFVKDSQSRTMRRN